MIDMLFEFLPKELATPQQVSRRNPREESLSPHGRFF